MGFFSFLGRVLFASLFILSAWQMFNEFGENGGPAVTELIPKLAIFKKHLSSLLGVGILDIDPRHLVAGMIALKGLGGFLFVFGSPFGAYLLLIYLVFSSPILYDFYNYDQNESTHVNLLNEFLQSVALFWCIAFLHRDEEPDSKETAQEEDSQGESGLGISKKQTLKIGLFVVVVEILQGV